MNRLPGWEINLLKIIEKHKDSPFQWGEHDCCRFSAACVEAMTGINPMDKFPENYHDKKTGQSVLKIEGRGTLLKTLISLFGPWVHPAKAQRGDLVFRPGKTGPSVGVCLGQFSAFVGEEDHRPGLVFFPTLSMGKAFKI